MVPLSVFFARKFCLPERFFLNKNLNQSLFLDKNSIQIDSLILYLIIFILCDGSSIGWVAVAVAVPLPLVGLRWRCPWQPPLQCWRSKRLRCIFGSMGGGCGGGPKGVAQASCDRGSGGSSPPPFFLFWRGNSIFES